MPVGKGPLRIAIEDFIEGIKVGERINTHINQSGEKLKLGSLGQSWGKILNSLGVDAKLPDIVSQNSPHAVLGLAALLPMLLGAVIGLGFSFISVVIQPIAFLAQYRVNRRWGAFRINPAQLAQLLKAFPEKTSDWTDQLLDQGVDEKSLNGLQVLNRQFLSALQYVALWRRGIVSETELSNKLKQLQMFDTDIGWLKELTNIIPPPNDLITMAVKEAFSEDFINRFQTAEGLPSAFVENAKKQGIAEEWARRYWIAHWQLPSPQQVFEMLHRLRPGKSNITVTTDDVKDYLKAADYSPFWRDKLTAISYSPFTRVDIRRMYKVGVLNEAQVKDAYLDIGYDDKHAQALTEFTIAYEAEEETGIVRSSVLSAYSDGMIDRATAEGMLAQGGYDATTIGFYLDNVDFKERLEVNQIKLNNIKKQFIEGLIDETNVNNQINQLNLPAERSTALLSLWLTERENQTALLSIGQMETLLEKGIVTSDDFTRIAKRRGYSDESIQWTLERIALEAADKAQKDAEKLQSDNERIKKSAIASQYQKDKSEIDLLIAQARAEITDIDVALRGKVSDQEYQELTSDKNTLEEDNADINLQIKSIKAELTEIGIQLDTVQDADTILRLSTRKDELTQAVADLNVVVAENKKAIVQINNQLEGLLSTEQVIDLLTRKNELKAFIASKNIAKAQLRFGLQAEISELGA